MPHPLDPTIKTRLLLRPVQSTFGTIRLGGVNLGAFGVGRPPGPRRTLRCFGLVYLLSGSGLYADATTRVTRIGKGDLVIFFPGQPHQCGTKLGEFWDELWFEFEGPVFDVMRDTRVLNARRPIHHTHDCDHWFRRFFQIIPPMHLRAKTPPQVTVSRFASVLTELLADSDAPVETPAPREGWIDTACDLLTKPDTHHSLSPAIVARRLGFSYETFRKKFRDAIGFSPGRFHLDARIDRAADLLHHGRQSIKEIAAQLAFCDEFYFSRCFKRRFGQAPRDFRRRVRGE